jgi:hypothetical protein
MKIGNKEKAFMAGLEKLSRETGVIIVGNRLMDLDDEERDDRAGYGFFRPLDLSEINWLAPADGPGWTTFKHTVVKAPAES